MKSPRFTSSAGLCFAERQHMPRGFPELAKFCSVDVLEGDTGIVACPGYGGILQRIG